MKEIAISDIFLDVAMFNSYSFLRQMLLPDKKNFSKLKAEYYQQKGLESIFINEDEEDLDYYSFAFSCHYEDENENICFDFDKYIEIWDDFINEYFSENIHQEPPVSKQIAMRVDNHIPNDYYKNFEKLNPGVYFILRVNKEPSSENRATVDNIIGKNNSTIGDLRIVGLSEALNYFKYSKELFRELNIAAFKIVVQ